MARQEARRARRRPPAREGAPPDAGEQRPAGATGRSDTADAFVRDPEGGPARAPDDLAEALAEDFVLSATSGEDADDEVLEEVVPEEVGGPFVETDAEEEFATEPDASNPPDAEREPLPRPIRGLIEKPRR
jgi:hypothetical protein